MIKIFKLIERFLRKHIMDSFLSQTMPLTRFLVCVLLSFCIFINDYMALGIFTSVILLLVLCSLETIRNNWPILILPVTVGFVIGVWAWFAPESLRYLGVSPVVLVWKFFNLCLAAAVFLILLPQRDLTLLVRNLPYPQAWVATIAVFRGVEIGAWAFETVSRTRRTKRIRLIREPRVVLDAFSTGICGHFLNFLDGFEIALRTRGVESESFASKDGPKHFSVVDVLAVSVTLLGLLALVAR